MRKSKFHKGQIIRIKGVAGTYFQILFLDRKYIYAIRVEDFNKDMVAIRFAKEDVIPYTQYSLCVSKEAIFSMRKGTMETIVHKSDTNWQKVYENPPKLIRFYSYSGYENIYLVKSIQKKLSLNEPVIAIEIGDLIVLL